MSLRNIERYVYLVNITCSDIDCSQLHAVVRLIYSCFAPIALALRIINIDEYDRFIHGNGQDIVEEVSGCIDVEPSLLAKFVDADEVIQTDVLTKIYDALFKVDNIHGTVVGDVIFYENLRLKLFDVLSLTDSTLEL